MPGETQIRSSNRMFMTLWMPDENSGSVRALESDPDVVTFEEAVDLVLGAIDKVLQGKGDDWEV
jgi:hypothetical protein